MSWWVYGALPRDGDTAALQGISGLADRAVERIGAGAVGIAASRVDAGFGAQLEGADREHLIDAIRRHDSVLISISRCCAVVPIRFGTLLADEEAVDQLLEAHGRRLCDAIGHVDGADEWVVHVSAPAANEEPSDAAAGLSPGRAFFARKRADAERAAVAGDRARAAAQALDHVLRPLARSRASLNSHGRAAVERVAYLVDRRRTTDFLEMVNGSEAPTQVSGPLPPYRFADPPA